MDMASVLCEIQLWSLKNQYAISVSHEEQQYYEEKHFQEDENISWTTRNKRSEKLKDSLKEVEELLSLFKCVQIRWKNRQVCQVVLSNATILTFVISGNCGDLERIYIDKSLTGKLSTETICDAYLTNQFFISINSDMNCVDYTYFTKRPPLIEAAKCFSKLSAWEPKVIQLDIPGPRNTALDRFFSMNTAQDKLLIWWSVRSGEAMPWGSMSTDRDRANIIILSICGPSIEVYAYTKTESDPLSAQFSCIRPHHIFTLEQEIKTPDEVKARSCTYEVIRGEIKTASVVNIILKNTIICQARHPQEDKLVLGCQDTSIVMYDDYRKVTLFTRTAILLSSLFWHPNGTLLIVASATADFQIFDRTLTPLCIQLLSQEPCAEKYLCLSKFLRDSVILQKMEWYTVSPSSSEIMTNYFDAFFILFNRGPVGLLKFHLGLRSEDGFSCVELVMEYLKHKQIDEAIRLLSSLNWDNEGETCCTCLSTIVNHLLCMPLNTNREAQLEAALATFYAPRPSISEITILEYRDLISQLARRFFHHLLRYIRFEKAFLLAVDIGARDLFMDIHFMAAEKGELTLAEVALRKAQKIESESIDQCILQE